MRYNTLLLDLDGTLTDPSEGITKCVDYSLKHKGIITEDISSLKRFIGPPLIGAFMGEYGMTEEEAWETLNKYRERFGEIGWRENEVYEGISEALCRLKSMGVRLALATSKPELYAERIVKHFGLAEHMVFIGGADMEETRSDKAAVIRYVLENLGVEDKTRVAMVGDRKHDIMGAKREGIDSIGILWGFGDRAELEAAGATHIAEDIEEFIKIVTE